MFASSTVQKICMSPIAELRRRFAVALQEIAPDEPGLLDMIRPAGDPKFGDYQANLAMPLGKKLGKPPREVAVQIAGRLDVADVCEPPEIAGPGFINLRLLDEYLARRLAEAVRDERLGVAPVASPRKYIVDYSSPNVAKPMHVGHIRSTVIGAAIVKLLRFLGHEVVSDNHLGDWGTQFGMIIYGYRHFFDEKAYAESQIHELARVYKIVSPLVDYYASKDALPAAEEKLQRAQQALAEFDKIHPATEGEKKAAKERSKKRKRFTADVAKAEEELASIRKKIEGAEADAKLGPLIASGKHAEIGQAVLEETAKLHAGEEDNLALWRQFMPACLDAIQQVYDRLGVEFDETLGESFYHDQLASVVDDLQTAGLASESDGAQCVFLDDFKAPMIVRKRDGAFLYATTDLATIRYRMQRWNPDAMLYVVDHRQGLHFEQLFAVARKWGFEKVELEHVSFGTVLGEDGRPFKTRTGAAIGLWGLLDEAARKARQVLTEGDGPAKNLPDEQKETIAESVGLGALVYADLSQDRTSDYVFSYDKMLALNGNTAAYMQYAYARVMSIFSRGEIDLSALRASGEEIQLNEPAERDLGLALLRFEEDLHAAASDYRPHLLTNYLYDLAGKYSVFFENCPVLKAEDEATQTSRLLMCDLTARTLRLGLELLNIRVVERM